MSAQKQKQTSITSFFGKRQREDVPPTTNSISGATERASPNLKKICKEKDQNSQSVNNDDSDSDRVSDFETCSRPVQSMQIKKIIEDDDDTFDEWEPEPKKSVTPITPKTPKQSYSNVTTPMSIKSSPAKTQPTGKDQDTWAHLHYEFLYPPKRMDIEQRTTEHPDHDERTLYLPRKFLDQQTPAMRQWWLIKQNHMDAILFFKMGKFYELFNQDAVTVVGITDIAFMKGDDDKPAHAGFPEVSYDKYANMLIERGFKVLRIEQTETPAMMEERCRRTGQRSRFDKVVAREVCQATTKGTQMMSITDLVFHTFNNQYLLAVCEAGVYDQTGSHGKERSIGVCFVDVTIGRIHMGQFLDDRNRSNLHTLLSHNAPVEIIYERGSLSEQTLQVLQKCNAIKSALKIEKEFWPIRTALTYLKVNNVFQSESGSFQWPDFLRDMFEDADNAETLISLEPKLEKALALKSFGALTFYLQSHLIASQVLSCAVFENYEPPLSRYDNQKVKPSDNMPPMVLDHVALRNLEVLENSSGETEGTLFKSINYCATHFGQRLLRNWVCSPLCDKQQISNRLDAIEVLVANKNQSLMTELSGTLKNVPDLERLLSRIKSQSFKSGAESRAILFENDQYSKSKINSFLNLLHTFKRLRKALISMETNVKYSGSETLKKLLTLTTEGGLYPDYEEALKYFDNAFNHDEAKKTGKIIPEVGVDEEYDECQSKINAIQSDLNAYLEEQRSVMRCQDVEYFGTGKNRFQLQVPESMCSNVPKEYRIESTRKGFKRYYTLKIERLLQEMMVAEEERNKASDNIMATIFGQFSRKFKIWVAAIECIAIADVLQSLAKYARSLQAVGIEVCRPNIDDSSSDTYMNYKTGRHPALVKRSVNFTPNNLSLDNKLVLLSGANMGGKSTLMRQTGILAILAQIGSYVPAAELTMSPVDRIFSRLGASDRIMEGESTFYTELVETSVMINHATSSSLLLLDELGRGTATYDGTAIAYSVIEEICTNIKCRCIFSTHYHSLVADYKDDCRIRLAHMACRVESADKEDSLETDPLKENLTFLYKIADGAAQRSYGFNVAKLAGIDPEIIKEAFDKAKEFEMKHKIAEMVRKMDYKATNLDKSKLKDELIAKIAV